MSAMRFDGRQTRDDFLERRLGLLRAAGSSPRLNIPHPVETFECGGACFLAERMPLGTFDGPARAVEGDLIMAIYDLHSAGWVHLDVKPENLMWLDGLWRLHDFDAAQPVGRKFSRRDITYAYAPPDVRRIDYADPSDDLYAAALMLFRLHNAGRLPLQAWRMERTAGWLRRHIPIQYAPPKANMARRKFFARALAHRRGERYHSVVEFQRDWMQSGSCE